MPKYSVLDMRDILLQKKMGTWSKSHFHKSHLLQKDQLRWSEVASSVVVKVMDDNGFAMQTLLVLRVQIKRLYSPTPFLPTSHHLTPLISAIHLSLETARHLITRHSEHLQVLTVSLGSVFLLSIERQ